MQKTAKTVPGKRKPRHTPAGSKGRSNEGFKPRSKDSSGKPKFRDFQEGRARDGQKPRSSEGFKSRSNDGFKPRSKEGFNPRSKDVHKQRENRDRSRDQAFDNARKKSSTGKTFDGDKVLSRLTSTTEAVESHETFQSMGLHEKIVTELAKMGASVPFPIQEATIPAAMNGRDILGRGKTGSGKTIAFGAPLISKLATIGSVPRMASVNNARLGIY